jgi:hypothetical protein
LGALTLLVTGAVTLGFRRHDHCFLHSGDGRVQANCYFLFSHNLVYWKSALALAIFCIVSLIFDG